MSENALPKAQFSCPLRRVTLFAGAAFALGVSYLLLDPIVLDRAPDTSTRGKKYVGTKFFLLMVLNL